MSNLKDLDDVDDDVFISKKPQNYIFSDKKANDINERTSKMLTNTRNLISESETVGQSTLAALSSQRETLERVENDLDVINNVTRYTQKKLKNMKSFFGAFKSIILNDDDDTIPNFPKRGLGIPRSATVADVPSNASLNTSTSESRATGSSRGITQIPNYSASKSAAEGPPEDEFEANLSEIGFGLSRLKEMALRMGDEVSDQNEIIDRITDKSDRAGDSIKHQNRQMQQILKKG